jgi:hypothetical protein
MTLDRTFARSLFVLRETMLCGLGAGSYELGAMSWELGAGTKPRGVRSAGAGRWSWPLRSWPRSVAKRWWDAGAHWAQNITNGHMQSVWPRSVSEGVTESGAPWADEGTTRSCELGAFNFPLKLRLRLKKPLECPAYLLQLAPRKWLLVTSALA